MMELLKAFRPPTAWPVQMCLMSLNYRGVGSIYLSAIAHRKNKPNTFQTDGC